MLSTVSRQQSANPHVTHVQTCYHAPASTCRWWQTDLWHELFDTLLNTNSSPGPGPLAQLRHRFESYLAGSHTARSEIRNLIRRQTIIIFDMRNSKKKSAQ